MKTACTALGVLLLASIGCQPVATTSPGTVDRDNTAVNERDRDGKTKTPLDQSNKQSDLDITAAIRSQMLKEEISVNARNIKIITADGVVTLRGPVKTQAEKDLADRVARGAAGVTSVENLLEVEAQP